MVDHLVLFAAREDASRGELEALMSALRGLKDGVPGVVDLTVGEDFAGRGGGYTHGLFARFESKDGLQEYLEHPDHLSAVEKLDALTTGRIVLDYEA